MWLDSKTKDLLTITQLLTFTKDLLTIIQLPTQYIQNMLYTKTNCLKQGTFSNEKTKDKVTFKLTLKCK